jgi:uncharacterized protein (TIGR04222 family)
LQTATAQLYGNGQLVLLSGGFAKAVSADKGAPREPLEKAVWATLGVANKPWLQPKLARSEIEALQAGLRARGLLLDDGRRTLLRLLTATLVLPLLGIGFLRFWHGLLGGRPVGELAMLLLVYTVFGVLLLIRIPFASQRGLSCLRQARASCKSQRDMGGAGYNDPMVGRRFALYGLGALIASSELSRYLGGPAAFSSGGSSSSDDGCSSCNSDSSSDSSSSGGGSGCGG